LASAWSSPAQVRAICISPVSLSTLSRISKTFTEEPQTRILSAYVRGLASRFFSGSLGNLGGLPQNPRLALYRRMRVSSPSRSTHSGKPCSGIFVIYFVTYLAAWAAPPSKYRFVKKTVPNAGRSPMTGPAPSGRCFPHNLSNSSHGTNSASTRTWKWACSVSFCHSTT